MSLAKQYALALDRRFARLETVLQGQPIDRQVQAYLKVVRRNERRREGLAPAATDRARGAILKLLGAGVGVTTLPYRVLTEEERAKVYQRGGNLRRTAFDKWFSAARSGRP